uniref:NADH dehydrogenase subunit 4L n=2 Tax=Anterhynchium TaxID=329989 RepID=A0A6M9ATZ4_9HYME|nr:NADH dehydrogenase subunit 4L [Anterhynchium aff. flavomarginatum HB]QKK69281.1 NADH dehydrogenase subunit 4L [Anterhynchium aff. flavomarginatum SC]
MLNFLGFSLVMLLLTLILMMKFFYHFLMMLMCLEFLVLSILYGIFLNMYMDSMEVYYLIIMVFFVIESVLGLTILIYILNFKGNDYMKNLSLMMW